MDRSTFDALTRSIANAIGRRSLLGGLLAAGLASGASPSRDAVARRPGGNVQTEKKRKKGKGRKRCKPRCSGRTCGPNGCGGVCGSCAQGSTCSAGQCLTCDVCAQGCDFTSVQAAIDSAAPGATITLCPERFRAQITTDKGFTLVGLGSGPTVTILDGAKGRNVLKLRPPGGVTIRNLTITRGRGSSTDGGGIFLEGGSARLTLESVHVTDSDGGSFGGGVYANADLTLTDCEIRGNAADTGGGVHVGSGSATLTRTLIEGNFASRRGGGLNVFGGRTVALDAVTIRENDATGDSISPPLGGGVLNQGTLTLTNGTTITGNSPSQCDNDGPTAVGCP